jgi:hypothetical protein
LIKEKWWERSWYLPNSWRVCLNFGYWFLTQPGTLIPAHAEFFLVKAWRANLLTRNSSPSRPRSVVNSIYWQHSVDQYFPVLFCYLLITKLEIYLSWSLLHLVGVDLSCNQVLFDSSFAHECVTHEYKHKHIIRPCLSTKKICSWILPFLSKRMSTIEGLDLASGKRLVFSVRWTQFESLPAVEPTTRD